MTNEQIIWIWDHYGLFGIVVAVLVVVIAFAAKSWKWFFKFLTTIDIVVNLPDRLSAIDATIAETSAVKSARLDAIDVSVSDIKKELTTNHGSSLKDAVYRIEEHLGLRLLN